MYVLVGVHVCSLTYKLFSSLSNMTSLLLQIDGIYLPSLPLPFLARIQSASHNKPTADLAALVLVLFKGCACVCLRNATAGLPQRGWRDQRSPDDPQHGHQLPQPVAQPRLTHTQQLRSVRSTCACCLFAFLPVGRLPSGNSLFDLSPFW